MFFRTNLIIVWCLFLWGTSETGLYHRDLMDNDEVPYNYDNTGIVRKSNNLRIREKPSPPFRTIRQEISPKTREIQVLQSLAGLSCFSLLS
jgi:hypothetical protein